MLLLVIIILLIVYLLPQYIHPRIFHDVITPEERNHIMRRSQHELRPSVVSTSQVLNENVRISDTAWLSRENDPIIDGVIRKCLKYVDRPIENCESLQVVRYKPGGFYSLHHDDLDQPNKRMYTFIIGLNDDYEGGETVFPVIKKSYRLHPGDVLLFDNLDNYEMKTRKALHKGNPVNNGEKWICNLWVRKYAIK